MAALKACSRELHFPLCANFEVLARKVSLLPLLKVAEKRLLKRSTKGRKASFAWTGRKPPRRSAESVCWLRLSTVSFAPTCRTPLALSRTRAEDK